MVEENKPVVKQEDEIFIGSGLNAREAIVSLVYTVSPEWEGRIEAVYLDQKGVGVAYDFFGNGREWDFVNPNLSGTYAENSDRLRKYVDRLKARQARSQRRRPAASKNRRQGRKTSRR
jgi:hypothetical protein